jgi:RimJ/RimL family protein N-acetyltransferase
VRRIPGAGLVFNGRMPHPVEIEAYGLLLRPWRAGDEPAALRGLTDPEFRRWNSPLVEVTDEEGARAFIRNRAKGWERGDSATFAVVEDGAVCGSVGIGAIDPRMRRGRVSYWTLPQARGRGLARRALEACSRWAFGDLGLHRLELGHALGNAASCAVALRCAYEYEGTLRGAMIDPAGGFRAMHLHARLADTPAPPEF